MKLNVLAALLLMSIQTSTQAAPPMPPSKISLVEIAKDSVVNNVGCVQFTIAGICFWLRCTIFGCSIETSTLVEHNNPDLIVEVSQTELRPLDPISTPLLKVGGGITQAILGGFNLGSGNQQGKSTTAHNLQFHDALALGNPALSMYDSTVGSIYGSVGWCSSNVMPLNPYFVSTASPEWRQNLLEGPMWLPNMFRNIGGLVSSKWGSIYPRIGFIHQTDTYKSSAVVAQRVADIVTTPGSLHLSTPLPTGSFGKLSWKPIKVIESNPLNSMWQLNYPRLPPIAGGTCHIFPTPDALPKVPNMTKNYVWTLWRRYQCCSIKGSFLYKVGM